MPRPALPCPTLCGAALHCTALHCAVLCCAVLCCAVCAVLSSLPNEMVTAGTSRRHECTACPCLEARTGGDRLGGCRAYGSSGVLDSGGALNPLGSLIVNQLITDGFLTSHIASLRKVRQLVMPDRPNPSYATCPASTCIYWHS